MWFVVIGVILLVLKVAAVGPPAQWSWWWVPVPWAIANASFKRQRRNASVTEIKEIPNRGHSLTIDSGWREVADDVLAWLAARDLDA